MLSELRLFRPLLRQCSHGRRSKFWWGHDTVEDQEARLKAAEDKKVLKWSNPNSSVISDGASKDIFYAPSRIMAEENALSNGYSYDRLNVSDIYSITTYKYFAWWTDPIYYAREKKVKEYRKLIDGQRFIRERLISVGPDLAAAHFLLSRGCKVRFKGQTTWMTFDDCDNLPQQFQDDWELEAINASNSSLIYEGFSNLRNLTSLKYLDLSYGKHINAWVMDRVSGEYSESLTYLDLSGCRNVNWNALEPIWRLSNLQTLVLRDMNHIRDLKLICLMLLDVFPNLEIRGVDYIDTKLLEGTESEELLKDDTFFLDDPCATSKK